MTEIEFKIQITEISGNLNSDIGILSELKFRHLVSEIQILSEIKVQIF